VLIEIAIGAAVVVEALLWIVALLSAGMDLVALEIVTVIVGAAIGAGIGALSSYTGVSATMVFGLEGLANSASGNQSANQPWWSTMAETMQWFDRGAGAGIAASALRESIEDEDTEAIVGESIAIALAIISAALAIADQWLGYENLGIDALVVAGLSLVVAVVSLAYSAFTPMKGMVIGMGALLFGYEFYQDIK